MAQIRQQPHTVEVYSLPSRQSGICLRCRCYCQLSSSLILLPSFCIMKIMKITPSRVLPRGGGAARCPTMWGCRCCHERAEECHPIYVSLVPTARGNSLPPIRIALMQLQIQKVFIDFSRNFAHFCYPRKMRNPHTKSIAATTRGGSCDCDALFHAESRVFLFCALE